MQDLLARLDRRPALYLMLGALLIALAHVSLMLGVLAWVAPVPWLRYLRVTRGARSRLAFVLALSVGWTLAMFKIASEPMFLSIAPLFSLPIAAAQSCAYLGWSALRRHAAPSWMPLLFALAVGMEEAALYSFTELGTWGATGHTQLYDLPLLQVASVLGLAGVGVLPNLVAATAEAMLAAPGQSAPTRRWGAVLGLVVSVHALGAARLGLSGYAEPSLLPVAAIATDSDVAGFPLPERETTHAWDRALLERTRRAASAGAELAVWTEAATLVWPDEEAAWVEALSRTAAEAGIDVVAGYVVPVSEAPLRYRNEYRLALADGTVLAPYAKYHPVPGEPAIPGTDPAPVTARAWGNLSGALCYDYDFPALGRARALREVDLVALPSSDWRGIDPVHGEMAVVRAIEGGHSLLRSTRWGLSVAADPYGRIRASRSAFEPGIDILHAALPHQRVSTLYPHLGDVPLALAFVVVAIVAWRRRTSG